jgi:hypothetical protein
MPKNEKSSAKLTAVASKVLREGKATPEEAKTLAGSVPTQAADRPKPKKAK